MKGEKGRPAQYDPKPRKCLGKCGKVFLSQGPGHRICAACRKAVGLLSRRQEQPIADTRGR